MKTFTKHLLAVTLLVAYFSGYGATKKFGTSNDGVYIPKTPVVTQNDLTMWIGKSVTKFASTYKSGLEWSVLHKSLSKSLTLPKYYPYNNFTANSSSNSMVGINMINSAMAWDEGKFKPSLNAYPNPSKGKITISLAQATDAIYKITVSNTIGQVIKTIKVPETGHNSDITVDLSAYPAGVYFYSLLVNDKMVETKRLILQQ
ncbi:T9SS type A sorting domain-containing protein [Adhaeribacter aquaticus]|uniref:T9SS type A sorting domain-containing protein n=1 Tax=Adhaeribacter aquaticus TaxID=299567 RepID=UPI0004152D5B|nr:T9SS type A sorting domain-containing protein [Adhaeribacter aquaticus]